MILNIDTVDMILVAILTIFKMLNSLAYFRSFLSYLVTFQELYLLGHMAEMVKYHSIYRLEIMGLIPSPDFNSSEKDEK